MIKDLSELRRNNWVPRKGGPAPAAEPVMNAPAVERCVLLSRFFFFFFDRHVLCIL